MSPGVTPTVAAAVFADAQRTWLVTSFVVPSFSRAFAVSFKLTPGRRTTAGDGTMSIDSMRGSATVIVAVPTASFARSVTRMTTEPGSEPAVMSPVLDTVAMLRFDEEYITRSVTCSTGPPGKRRVTESCIVFPLTSVVAEGATSIAGSWGSAQLEGARPITRTRIASSTRMWNRRPMIRGLSHARMALRSRQVQASAARRRGVFASAFLSRWMSAGRSVTGPRRAAPPVE